MKIEIIAGSPREGSQTRRVALHLLKELDCYDQVEVGMIDLSRHNIPPVNEVISSVSNAPVYIREIAERVFHADAFILVSPEYNGSYSPAMKNLLDHFPKQDKKTIGLVTASPGAFGGIRAAVQLQNLTYGLMAIGSPQMLIVPEMEKKFDENGRLIDPNFKGNVGTFIENFLWLAYAVSTSSYSIVQKKCA